MKEIAKQMEIIGEKWGVEAFEEIKDIYSKLISKINDLTKSRNNWKAKYKLRNDDAKDYAKTITQLQKEIKYARKKVKA